MVTLWSRRLIVCGGLIGLNWYSRVNPKIQSLREASLFMGWGAVSGKRFHMVSRIVLCDTLVYSFWTLNGILKGKFGGFKIFRPLRIGPSKIFAHYESGRFAHFEKRKIAVLANLAAQNFSPTTKQTSKKFRPLQNARPKNFAHSAGYRPPSHK